ncbi:MAG: ribosome small subunit-dependent GTPase A [Chloroflexi bacterium RBG_16_58_14]|nr:MAG: ribosome small subunit-dependent GTPase A [Chloroflexi bacterium RBG_16_58_14]
MPGLIVRLQSGFYTVQTDLGLLECHLRGRLKKSPRSGDIAALGDRVEVELSGPGRGMIAAVMERTRALSRLAPTPRGIYHQIIIANPDQAVFIFACARPAPHPGMLDRFLVISEKQGIPPLVVANKVDLVGDETARLLFGRYSRLEYSVVYTSARSGQGVDQLRQQLLGKISVFAGPSGAGKSTLLNRLLPNLDLAAREVSQATSKGKHTTVWRELYPLADGGYVADTPGLKALALWDIEAEELDGYFPEMRPLVASCQFNDCSHVHEPGCAVLAAVADGRIHPERYESYLRMRFGEQE